MKKPQLIHERVLANEKAVKFLYTGMNFSLERYYEVLEMFRDIVSGNQALPALTDEEIGEHLQSALFASVEEALRRAGAKQVRMGISGGLDSRLLYSVVREFLPASNICTYTFGTPGQADFELIKHYGKSFLSNHVFLLTSQIKWDVNHEVERSQGLEEAKAFYSIESNFRGRLEALDYPKTSVSGFLGDALAGGTRPSLGTEDGDAWETAIRMFLKKNNRFKLQTWFGNSLDIRELLPPKPSELIPGFDFYDHLNVGFRQYQRIKPAGIGHIIPYTDKRWISAILRIRNHVSREEGYYRLLTKQAPDCFPEVAENGIQNRGQHARFKRGFVKARMRAIRKAGLKNGDGSRYTFMALNKQGKPMLGTHYCDFAEYHNNPTFKVMFLDLLGGLKRRQLFDEQAIEEEFAQFIRGDRDASLRLRGLANFELNLRAGTIQV